MDHCSFYDHGMTYALNNDVVALVARDVATTFGSVYLASPKDTEWSKVKAQLGTNLLNQVIKAASTN